MYLHEEEEDEKSSDPYTYDIKVYEAMRKVLEHKAEELKSTYNQEFITHLLTSESLSGVSIDTFPLNNLVLSLEYQYQAASQFNFCVLWISKLRLHKTSMHLKSSFI